VLDGLSYEEKTKRGGPDGTVAASVQLPGAAWGELKDAVDVLREAQRALKRTNALTLADLIALSGAEAVAAVGGPEISVQLGRTDSPKLLEDITAVTKGGRSAAESRGILPGVDLDSAGPEAWLAAFRRSGFTEREAAVLMGTYCVLKQPGVVDAKPVSEENRGDFAKRGSMGRLAVGAEKKSANVIVDLYGTNEGEEDASVDRMDGDIGDFYIADAFGSRKQAYGRRISSASTTEATFNELFVALNAKAKKGEAGANAVESALLADGNTRIWVQKYAAERLTYLKDLTKTFYRVTSVGAQYTGGKYAALLDNKKPDKLKND